MGLVDDQIRRAMRASLQAMLDDWSDIDFTIEHIEDQVFIWTTKHMVTDDIVLGEKYHVAAAFVVSELEQEAIEWYEELKLLRTRAWGGRH